MLKITPNSPISSSIESIDPHIVDRALAHYNLPPGASSKRRGANSTRKISAEPESREEILVDASSILESAAATAYEHADNLTGPERKVAMGVVRLIELAQGRVDSVLEDEFTSGAR
ncbi:hypothetical protein [Pseudomonas sp. MWU12-2345]|uniref:DUF6124 family protein n=1 Tax=Pseudomonas sp. MWU12-2345 TaxID=2928689 RepID=UPI00200C1F4F|nr:hypothetical protein [Pseudomonas sp. MWU12-2345]